MRYFNKRRLLPLTLAAMMALAMGLPSVAMAVASPLDAMKDEFATLMKKRAGLGEKCRASQLCINASRSATDQSTETARAYRRAAQATEQALDAHPDIIELQKQFDAAQTEKVEVSRQQAVILDAWHNDEEQKADQIKAMFVEADTAAAEARDAIFKKAGVTDPRKFSDADRRLYQEVGVRFSNEVVRVQNAKALTMGAEVLRAARVQDGSTQRFEESNARYQELERKQADLTAAMLKLRTSLRTDDAVVAKAQRAALEASQKHVVAMDATPEVARARAFLADVNKLRVDIDKQARVLRKAILEKDSEYREILDKQAIAGGLALVGEDFWKE